MAITLRQIQAFLAVTEQGTFTKAAERLNMAQPALSQLVRDLERELGIRVLDRTTRRVELTEGGREFHGAALKIVQDLDTAVLNATGLAERRRGRIVVAVPPLLAAVIMPPTISFAPSCTFVLPVSSSIWKSNVVLEMFFFHFSS